MRRLLLAVAIAVLALAGGALAHGGGPLAPGDTLARATPLGLPARVFDDAPSGVDAHYFRVDVPKSATVRLRLVAPEGQEPAQPPLVIVFGPSFQENVSAPPEIERPDAGGVSFVAAERAPDASGALGARWTLLLDRSLQLEPGEHFVVVRTAIEGPIALLLDTSASRWLDAFLLPGLRDDVRGWQGAPAWPALAAGALAAAGVATLGWRWRRRAWPLHAMGAFILAILAAGTSLALATDAMRTGAGWSHASAGLLAAVAALASTRPALPRPRAWQRGLLAGAALLSFFACAGALWGPVVGLAAALLPEPAQT